MRRTFQGSLVAMVTPFHDGKVDEGKLRELVEFHIANGTDGLVPCGTTGESPTLSHAEQKRVVEIVIQQARGRIPVVPGTGSYSTADVIEMTRHVAHAGASGALIVTPYYNKPTQQGLYEHYRAIAQAVPDLPLIVYNIQGRTAVNVETDTLARLAQIPNIVGVKEASGNVSQMCEICRAVPDGFLVLSGDDALTLPLMAVGGRGIISVASNEIPAEMVQMVELAERNDFAAARQVHARILPLMSINFIESNPGPVKAAMAAMGLLEEVFRLPMVAPRAESKEKILQVLKELGALKGAMV